MVMSILSDLMSKTLLSEQKLICQYVGLKKGAVGDLKAIISLRKLQGSFGDVENQNFKKILEGHWEKKNQHFFLLNFFRKITTMYQ